MKRANCILGGLLLVLIWGIGCEAPGSASGTSDGTDSTQVRRDSIPDGPEAQVKALTLQIQQQPQDYGLFQRRAEAYYELDSLSRARADIEQALKIYPEGPELHYWKGFLSYVTDDTIQALRSLREAQRLGTRNPEVPYQIGQIFFLQGKYSQSLDAYREAARLDPYDPQYIFAQGYWHEDQQQYDRAAQLYKQSLGIDSTYARALTRLHDLYLNHYESETEAMKYNAMLLRYAPGHPLGRFQNGNYHLRRALAYADGSESPEFRQHINDAVLSYTITVNNDPNFAEGWYNRGFCYFLGEGRLNEAISDFEQCIRVDSTHAPAHFMLGSISEKNGDYRSALEYYQQALRYKPQSDDFRQAVADMNDQLNRN